MPTTTYAIVFDGTLKPGFETNQVKANFAKVFKSDVARVEALFSGKPVVIKKGLDKASAAKYQQVLQKAGAEIKVMVQKTAAPAHTTSPNTPQEQTPGKSTPATQNTSAKMPEVLPAGEELLRPEERKKIVAPAIDTSHLQVQRNVATFGPADEEEPTAQIDENADTTPRADVDAPDFDLAPTGSDLGEQRNETQLPTLDLSDYSIAEVGADVLAEKPTAPLPPAIDLSELSVAEQDGELYPERPKTEAPPAPDTTHLSLSE